LSLWLWSAGRWDWDWGRWDWDWDSVGALGLGLLATSYYYQGVLLGRRERSSAQQLM
jgi:hypothetical protein